MSIQRQQTTREEKLEQVFMYEETEIDGVVLFTPRRFSDSRGWFSETYNQQGSAIAYKGVTFVQDNQSCSVPAFTMRGLHFQIAPRAQDKLVRVISGSVIDVAVDIRVGSPTFGMHVARLLSAENGSQLFVPKGFAHGFMTLEPNSEVVYKVSDYYAPECERGLLWRDPALAINWQADASAVTVVDRDDNCPTLAELPTYFSFDGSPNH
jgi:dTDP-4-dehydrorhamnose 3,5-epimerase